ncbi:tetratricopeptide repeat protein [Haliovirga abyssi]|uniref:Tetratricopeptide repeat protein n=1 Tax=Haliovirga abyssi TaxID=2996794 RepID=A0AAU9DGM0_9FUSO|nr:tetratricopeptide repeat protein [Haliovirga abyssi]BDU50587.1 hypothetical protein HLVA_11560 [Haliovirga abyssi]
MNKIKRIRLFIIFMLLIYSISFSEEKKNVADDIIIENPITVGDRLIIHNQNNEERDWSLIKKPIFSNLQFNLKKTKLNINLDIAGEYKIKSNDDLNNYKIKTVVANPVYDEKNLLEEFENGYKEKKLNLTIKIFEKTKNNFPNNINLKKEAEDIVKLSNEKEEYNILEKYSLFILENFKLSYEDEYYFLKNLYNSSLKIGDINIEGYSLKKLIFFDERYKKELGLYYLNNNIDKKKGIEILEGYYNIFLDKSIAEILGDYYLTIDEKKSIVYYKKSNLYKLSNIYLKNGEINKIKNIIENIPDDEKKDILSEIDNYKKDIKLKEYYKKAKKSLKKYNLSLAKIYYNKILLEVPKEELLKKIYFDLGQLNFLKKDYVASLKYFNKNIILKGEIKAPEELYNIAVIYYEEGNYEKSISEFDKLINLFPNTIWEVKANIYKIKFSNRKEN